MKNSVIKYPLLNKSAENMRKKPKSGYLGTPENMRKERYGKGVFI